MEKADMLWDLLPVLRYLTNRSDRCTCNRSNDRKKAVFTTTHNQLKNDVNAPLCDQLRTHSTLLLHPLYHRVYVSNDRVPGRIVPPSRASLFSYHTHVPLLDLFECNTPSAREILPNGFTVIPFTTVK